MLMVVNGCDLAIYIFYIREVFSETVLHEKKAEQLRQCNPNILFETTQTGREKPISVTMCVQKGC